MNKFFGLIEQIFERILWESRLMVILAVVASVLAALNPFKCRDKF